jgi:hypothetical protein
MIQHNRGTIHGLPMSMLAPSSKRIETNVNFKRENGIQHGAEPQSTKPDDHRLYSEALLLWLHYSQYYYLLFFQNQNATLSVLYINVTIIRQGKLRKPSTLRNV